MAGSTVGLPGSYTLLGPPEMIRPLRPASWLAGVSLGRTSAYTPKSLTLRAIRWQYWPPASSTVIWGVLTEGARSVTSRDAARSHAWRIPAELWLWEESPLPSPPLGRSRP